MQPDAPPDRMATMHIRIVATTLLALSLPCQAARPANLCTAGESVVFNCRAGAKTLSICERRAASGELLYAQYRFGRDRAELAIPPQRPFDLSAFRGESTHGTHAVTELLTVRNGDVVYAIEQLSYLKLEEGLRDQTGISVTQDGDVLARFDCVPRGRASGLFEFIRSNHLEPPQSDSAP